MDTRSAHAPANLESNFLCTPTVTALFTPGFHQSISISLRSALPCLVSTASQLQPACLLVRLAVS